MHVETYEQYCETYDRETVNVCRSIVRKRQFERDAQIILSNGMNTGAIQRVSEAKTNIDLYHVMGRRYKEKEEVIQNWMKEDARKDVVEKNAIPPTSVYCESCNSEMEVESRCLIEHYDVEAGIKVEEVKFLFACPRECDFKPFIHQDGSPVMYEASPCPRCEEDLHIEVKDTNNKSVHTSTCTACGYTKRELFCLDIQNRETDTLFSKDRAKYCMSDERGQQYLQGILLLDLVWEGK